MKNVGQPRKYLLMLLVLMVFVVSCAGGNEPQATAAVAGETNLDYLVSTDEAPAVQVSGPPFDVVTDNCGAGASAIESFSRSREFQVTMNAEISEEVRGKLGGDILVARAELEAAVGVKLGVEVGSTETVQTERQIETPANKKTIVSLQWEEIWQPGTVTIIRSDNSEIGNVPFRIVTTLRLSQIGVQEIACDTPTPGSDPPVAETKPPPPPTNTDTPTEPTLTPIPAPTNTAEPTLTPQSTSTPVGMVSTTYEVDAYRTALGDPANTGVFVQAGDTVHITYLYGQWWIGQSNNCNGTGSAQTPTDAAGYVGREGDRVEALIGCSNPNMCRPLINAAWGSLIGQIGETGPLFPIGGHYEFVAQTSGILFLRINYFNHNAVTGCPYGDGGEITVGIDVIPPQ